MMITRQLADFVVSTPSNAIPEAVRCHMVRSTVNWVACALGGAHDPTVLTARRALSAFMGPEIATLIGHADKVDVPRAALLNGISSHVLDFDDTHLETLVHPSGPVLSALFALSAVHPLNGRDFIDAAVMGVEAECRIAQGLGRAHYDAGWHVTGTAGVCGAAVAAGRALGLSAQHLTWAIGIAATQASGLREMFGSMCKSLHAGKAAENGLTAAFLAQAGFTSSDSPLEAPRGMANVMSATPNLSRVLDGLGEVWETSANTFKPYACGLVIHPVIDACRELAAQGVYAAEVDEVLLLVHPLVLELTGKRAPATGLEAKFSVYHCAAATLVDKVSLPEHFSVAGIQNPRVQAVRERVRAEIRDDIRPDEARVRAVLKDGSRHDVHVPHALGSLARPMSEDDVSGKFRMLAGDVLPAQTLEDALQQLWRVEQCVDLNVLQAVLRQVLPRHAEGEGNGQ